MTKDEAILVLTQIKKAHETMPKFIKRLNEKMAEERIEALDLAIESLSADTVSRSQYQGLLNAIGKVYVEVVRCKDCRHRYYADSRVPHERTWVCERFANEEITDNDFCSWGERREQCD